MFDKLFLLLKAAVQNAGLRGSNPDGEWVSIKSLPTDADLNKADDMLHLTLLNVEEERVLKSQQHTRRDPNNPSRMIVANPEIKLNVYVMAAAFFTNYTEALKRLAYVIRVFQRKNVYSPQDVQELLGDANDIPPILDQVIVDLYSQSLDQQYQFSQSLGNRQIPAVIYKVRLMVIDELFEEPPEMPVITTIGISTGNN